MTTSPGRQSSDSNSKRRVLLHPDDEVLWKQTHLSVDYSPLTNDQQITFAGTEIRVIHTPGHSPGSVCTHRRWASCAPADTLFRGGPGATGWSYSDFLTVIESIRARLLTLPTQTVVHTGHGDDTTIGAEAPHLRGVDRRAADAAESAAAEWFWSLGCCRLGWCR